MTNAELIALLQTMPPDAEVYVPFDREGDNFQQVAGIITKNELANKFRFLSLGDIEDENGIVIY